MEGHGIEATNNTYLPHSGRSMGRDESYIAPPLDSDGRFDNGSPSTAGPGTPIATLQGIAWIAS